MEEDGGASSSAQPPAAAHAEAPAPKARRMYITEAMIQRFGGTFGCGRCEGTAHAHAEHCRVRVERLLHEKGELPLARAAPAAAPGRRLPRRRAAPAAAPAAARRL